MRKNKRLFKKRKNFITLMSFLCCLNVVGLGFASWQIGTHGILGDPIGAETSDIVLLESVTKMISSAEISSDISYYYYENENVYGVYNSTYSLKLKLDLSDESFLANLAYDDEIYDRLTLKVELYYLNNGVKEVIENPTINGLIYSHHSTTFYNLDNTDNTFSISLKSKNEKSIYMIAQNDIYNLNTSGCSYVYIDFNISALDTLIESKSIYSEVSIGYTIK